MRKSPDLVLLSFAQLSLMFGLLAGVIGSVQYFFPEIIPFVSFQKMRPMHVTLVVAWIIGSAVAIVWRVLKTEFHLNEIRRSFGIIIPYTYLITGILIILHYFAGKFGGREYWEFPPYMAIGIYLTWIFFAFVFIKKIRRITEPWPVYLWMWLTGVIFFLITFTEANLWLLPYFRNDIVKDITIQWKAQGALVGSWNMLVYGIAIYISEKIAGDKKVSHSNMAFASFFLGFFNLLFGWAHHIYIVPCPVWIRMFSYAVSMTELLVIAKIIHDALKNRKEKSSSGFWAHERLIAYADNWILLNLFLAILISIPAINIYTHGTHVTVAHAMGSTIGINTFILLSAIAYFNKAKGNVRLSSFYVKGFNYSLFVFWVALISAGVARGVLTERDISFNKITLAIKPFLWVFCISGFGILYGLGAIVLKNIRAAS